MARGWELIWRLMGYPLCGPKTWLENQFCCKDFQQEIDWGV